MLKRNWGFNLIELMVTISVLALLLLAAVPNVAASMKDARSRSVAEHILQGLNKARVEAVKHNRNVTFLPVDGVGGGCKFSTQSAAWIVSIDDPQGRCDRAPSAAESPRILDTFAAKEISRDVVIQILGRDGSVASAGATFNGYGQLQSTTGGIARIDISHSGQSARLFSIEVSAAGGVRLCDRALARDSGDPRACTKPT